MELIPGCSRLCRNGALLFAWLPRELVVELDRFHFHVNPTERPSREELRVELTQSFDLTHLDHVTRHTTFHYDILEHRFGPGGERIYFIYRRNTIWSFYDSVIYFNDAAWVRAFRETYLWYKRVRDPALMARLGA